MKWLLLILMLLAPTESKALSLKLPTGTKAERRARRLKAIAEYRKQTWKTYIRTDRRIHKVMRVTSNLLQCIRFTENKRPLSYYKLRKMVIILKNRYIAIADEIANLNVRVSVLEDSHNQPFNR